MIAISLLTQALTSHSPTFDLPSLRGDDSPFSEFPILSSPTVDPLLQMTPVPPPPEPRSESTYFSHDNTFPLSRSTEIPITKQLPPLMQPLFYHPKWRHKMIKKFNIPGRKRKYKSISSLAIDDDITTNAPLPPEQQDTSQAPSSITPPSPGILLDLPP